MNKLKLNVEELEVTSFEIAGEDLPRGTVEAQSEGDITVSCGDPFSSLYKYYRMVTTTFA